MPIYEYQCESCGGHLEILQDISDPALNQCPLCHKETLKKLVSASGFRLSGRGWYETDFKKTNQRNLAGQQESKPAPEKKERADNKKTNKVDKQTTKTDKPTTE